MLTKLCLTQHNINSKSFLCVSLFCMGKHEHVGASMLAFFYIWYLLREKKKGIKMSPIQVSCKKKKKIESRQELNRIFPIVRINAVNLFVVY